MLQSTAPQATHFIPHEDMLDFSDFFLETDSPPWPELDRKARQELITEFVRDESNSDPVITQQGDGVIALHCIYLDQQKIMTIFLDLPLDEISRLLQDIFF